MQEAVKVLYAGFSFFRLEISEDELTPPVTRPRTREIWLASCLRAR